MKPPSTAVAASDLWRIPYPKFLPRLGAWSFFPTLRDENTGLLLPITDSHNGSARKPADLALKQSHWQCFSEWLAFGLEEQKADLDLIFRSIDSDKKTILETWMRTKPYLQFDSGERHRSRAAALQFGSGDFARTAHCRARRRLPQIETHSDSGHLADDVDFLRDKRRLPESTSKPGAAAGPTAPH